MKRITLISIIALAGITLISCTKEFGDMTVSSCKPHKETPVTVETLPTASFSLTAVEQRQTSKFNWTIDQDGHTDSVRETIDDMYVSPSRSFTITAHSDDPVFEGVLVSVNGTGVNTSRKGNGTFTKGSKDDVWEIKYDSKLQKKGPVTVTVAAGTNKVSFQVICAPDDVPHRGVIIEFQGKEIFIPRRDWDDHGQINNSINEQVYIIIPNNIDYKDIVFSYLRPVPENAWRGPGGEKKNFDYYEGKSFNYGSEYGMECYCSQTTYPDDMTKGSVVFFIFKHESEI